jgi:hypothetical protein
MENQQMVSQATSTLKSKIIPTWAIMKRNALREVQRTHQYDPR